MKFALKLLAPYLAVGVLFCGSGNAWLAILAYHAQILFWSRRHLRAIGHGRNWRALAVAAAPFALAGPATFFLLPVFTGVDIGGWLARYGLEGWALIALIPYFGLIHPSLEQAHWQDLWAATPLAGFVFAGYHAIVLSALLPTVWLVFCCLVLLGVSFLWRFQARKYGGLFVPAATHTLADAGIILAVWLRIS